MKPQSYTQPFDNYCQVTIPGTVHGFEHLTPDDITCTDVNNPAKPLTPAHIAIDDDTWDVTVTFVMPESGTVHIGPRQT